MNERTKPCAITLCGMDATEAVKHPQRGEMTVCQTHAKRIQALPKWRFIGNREVAQ